MESAQTKDVPTFQQMGRYGHHADRVVDAEVEIDRLEGLLSEARAVRELELTWSLETVRA